MTGKQKIGRKYRPKTFVMEKKVCNGNNIKQSCSPHKYCISTTIAVSTGCHICTTQPCSPPFLSFHTSFLPSSAPFILIPVLQLKRNRSISVRTVPSLYSTPFDTDYPLRENERKRKLYFHNGGNTNNYCVLSTRKAFAEGRSCVDAELRWV